ncbi:uncharacterized protein LOC119463673 isoform X4 [Dermacentor silvarum]|uniref:uncharacterized protein LOC119463673 isoform X4 n=1 Tax=Dermacentor silvarum TaxID=543639 RepID=UPI00210140EC|nr:uncharacterized protein LOC119463673 isoform X4 [Dermacentor silvarum]
MSSLIVDREQGGVQVRGILSHHLRIAPLEMASRSSDGNTPHEITVIKESPTVTSRQNGEAVEENLYEQHCNPIDIEKRGVEQKPPDLFRVEVCIVVSKKYASAFNTSEDLLLYIGAMINGDEFLFGNVVCDIHPNASEDSNTVCPPDAEKTLNKTTDYVNVCTTGHCDIVYHLTREDIMYYINSTHGIDIDGLSDTAGVCTEAKFAIGEDKPHTYSGLVVMAHEIGHLLGSDHDSCPGAKDCPASYGFLMTNLPMETHNKSKLSDCSQKQIRSLVRRLNQSCVSVNTRANYTNDVYPGENMTYEAFCKLTHPEIQDLYVSKENLTDCLIKCCDNSTESADSQESLESSPLEITSDDSRTTEGIYEYYPYEYLFGEYESLLDGMACGDNMTCYRGICGIHNWSEIRRNYRTLRTFEKMPYVRP